MLKFCIRKMGHLVVPFFDIIIFRRLHYMTKNTCGLYIIDSNCEDSARLKT